MTNNQGIMHAATSQGGFPLCRNPKAHMSTTVDRFRIEPKQCKRCAVLVAKIDEKQRRKDEQHYYTLRIGQNKPRILPPDIQSWDYATTTFRALVMIWLPRKLTAWECEHYGLTEADSVPEMVAEVLAPVVSVELDRQQLTTIIEALELKRANMVIPTRRLHITNIINMLKRY